MNKKQDRRRLIIIAIIALLALLLGVGIYCIATDMFLNTYALVGGNGTQCTSANQSYTYARIDRPGSPGFFTEK